MTTEEIAEWRALRLKLNQGYAYSNVWEDAIKLFDNRLRKKFFSPIQELIRRRALEGEGFAIVTVQCALIETLSAFREGKIYNYKANAKSPKYEYKESKSLFVNFLNSAEIFQGIFWEIDTNTRKVKKDYPFSADDFYSSVRCGLMHEARTKNNWLIRAAPKTISVKAEIHFIKKENESKVIYRTILHYRLLAYLNIYLDELRQENNVGERLRKFLARKLDHLLEFEPDKLSDWWVEM